MQRKALLTTWPLDHAARWHADSTAAKHRDLSGAAAGVTYGELRARCVVLARALEVELGVKRGENVATLSFNTCEHLTVYHAIAGAGAVTHTLNPRFGLDQLAFVVGEAEDKVLFVDPDCAELALDVLA